MANARFRPRGDTAANWTAGNPTLALREIGLELDTGKWKVGDGSTAWNSLGYFGGSASITSSDVTTALGYTPMRGSNNLSEITNAATARTNLGLGTAATSAATAFLATASNLSDVPSAATARTNLGVTGGFTAVVANRTALAALSTAHAAAFLKEADRQGVFVWDGSDLSAMVTADTQQAIYVPPTGQTGSTGAWVRSFFGPLRCEWFGLVEGDVEANGATNTAAFTALLAVVSATGIRHVVFPSGIYWFDDNGSGAAIDLLHGQMIIEGPVGGGLSATPTSYLSFTSGTTGIRIHDSLSSGANTKDAVSHGNGDGTVLRNLTLKGYFPTSGVEAEAHGIQLRRKATLENISIQGFEGDGIFAAANLSAASGAAVPYGNNNNSMFYRVSVKSCRKGIYLDGSDANAITVILPNLNSNRQCGIWASSFICNFDGAQLATNGITPDNDGVTIAASACSHGGNRYGVVVGEEVWAAANSPSGTTAHNQGWYYIEAGGVTTGFPAWFAGISVRAGGPVIADGLLGENTFKAVYIEEGELKGQLAQTNFVIGGNLFHNIYNNTALNQMPGAIGAGGDAVQITPMLEVTSGDATIWLGDSDGNSNNYGLRLKHATYANATWRLGFNPNAASLGDLWLNYNSSTALTVTGPNTPNEFGTGAAYPNAVYIPSLMIAGNSASSTNARRLTIDTAAPSTGAHAQGEFNIRRTGTTTDPFASRCVTAGTPGTWQALYALSQLQAAGSGLTVSATDKLLGRSAAGAGAVEEITCTAAGRALIDDADAAAQRTTLGLGTAATSASSAFAASGAVTGSGLTMATARLLGRTTAATGAIEEISVGATLTLSAGSLAVAKVPNAVTFNTSGGAAAGTTFDGSAARTIDYSTVGAAKTGAVTGSGLTASATDKLIGRSSASGGALEEIACTAAGRALLDDADAAAQRTTLGLGTAATSASTAFLASPSSLADRIALARLTQSCVVLGQSAVAQARTGVTTEGTMVTVNVPAAAMGVNGRIMVRIDVTGTTTANKTVRLKLGATTLWSSTMTSAQTGVNVDCSIANRNAQNSQRWASRHTNSGNAVNHQAGTATVDTSASTDITITIQNANTADTTTIESYQVLLYPAD